MGLLDPHLGAGVYRIQESLADIRVYLVCKIPWRGTSPHQESIRQYVPLLVSEMVLVFHRVDNNHIEEFKDGPVDGPLDPRSFALLHDLCDLGKTGFLGR